MIANGYPYQCQAALPTMQRCPAATTTVLVTDGVPDLMLCDSHALAAQELIDATAELMRRLNNARNS